MYMTPLYKRLILIALIFSFNYILAQNVGIGTTNPTEKLHVNGDLRINGLAGTANRLVITDANGVLTAVSTTGAAGEVLTSDGL